MGLPLNFCCYSWPGLMWRRCAPEKLLRIVYVNGGVSKNKCLPNFNASFNVNCYVFGLAFVIQIRVWMQPLNPCAQTRFPRGSARRCLDRLWHLRLRELGDWDDWGTPGRASKVLCIAYQVGDNRLWRQVADIWEGSHTMSIIMRIKTATNRLKAKRSGPRIDFTLRSAASRNGYRYVLLATHKKHWATQGEHGKYTELGYGSSNGGLWHCIGAFINFGHFYTLS